MPPSDDAPSAYPDTPVPDYTEGHFFPERPHRDTRSRTSHAGKRSPLKGTFGPGFQFQTEDEEFGLHST